MLNKTWIICIVVLIVSCYFLREYWVGEKRPLQDWVYDDAKRYFGKKSTDMFDKIVIEPPEETSC